MNDNVGAVWNFELVLILEFGIYLMAIFISGFSEIS
jgi:hypothetical protein